MTTTPTMPTKPTKPTKPTTRGHLLLVEDDLWRELKIVAAQRNTTVSHILRHQAEKFLRRLQRQAALKAGLLLLLALSTSACATARPFTPAERGLPLQVACDTVSLADRSGLATLAVCSAALLQHCWRTP
jgi:hypothetical protein